MTVRAASLLDSGGDGGGIRWSVAALVVAAAHVGLIAAYLTVRQAQPAGARDAPAVIVDLSPMPAAPASPTDAAPGPEMAEAEPPPEPPVVEPPPPEPQQVAAPPPLEPPLEMPAVALPEPPAVKPPPKPPEHQKHIERKPPAPRTAAAPRSNLRSAERPSAPSPGSADSKAALAAWRDLVVAKLQRAKRYPAGAESRREQGVATLSFSLSRSGGVLGRSIARSSGSSDLDQEVLAMVQRAAPFPPFPAAMAQGSVQLAVPIRFSLR